MVSKNPVILGYDGVSALGTNWDDQWTRLSTAESGIAPLSRFPLVEKSPVRISGEVPPFDESEFSFLAGREMAHWTSPIFKHALLVVHRALKNAGVDITASISARTAVTFSTAVGGIDVLLNADREWVAKQRLPNPFVDPNSCINMVTGKVAILTGATGPIVSTVNACATGLTSIVQGSLFIDSGMADLVICGAVDFPLIETTIAGFGTMNGAFKSKAGELPAQASCPFAEQRRGFVVSEGAAAVILASRAFAEAHGLPFATELAGFGMTADARHFVAPHRPTVRRCMETAIAAAGIAPLDIQAINAHAASTKLGDRIEYEAMTDVFTETLPAICANKGQIGHAMGAASALETCFAIEAMQRDVHLPTLNYKPDPELPISSIVPEGEFLRQEHVLKNAFGFGGCNVCAVFRRVDAA